MSPVEWLIDTLSFAFLDTAIGVIVTITVYVLVKLVQESRN